jgi:psiF repeat
MRIFTALAHVVVLLAAGGTAFAQQQPGAMKSRSTGSMECSKQADEKGLHGKARKHFRSKCMKDLRKQAAWVARSGRPEQ